MKSKGKNIYQARVRVIKEKQQIGCFDSRLWVNKRGNVLIVIPMPGIIAWCQLNIVQLEIVMQCLSKCGSMLLWPSFNFNEKSHSLVRIFEEAATHGIKSIYQESSYFDPTPRLKLFWWSIFDNKWCKENLTAHKNQKPLLTCERFWIKETSLWSKSSVSCII